MDLLVVVLVEFDCYQGYGILVITLVVVALVMFMLELVDLEA